MRKQLFILFVFIQIGIKAQSVCSVTAAPIGEIFYPYTTSSSTVDVGIQYLCGPNTILYDTMLVSCRDVFVDNNSTLFLKASCPTVDHIYLKSNCTLNVLNGSAGITGVWAEPGATINNYATSPSYHLNTVTCSSIIYPYVNCTVGLNEKQINSFKIYPNPANDVFYIDAKVYSSIDIKLFSIIGEFVIEKTIDNISIGLDVSKLANGIYVYKAFNNGLEIKVGKLIISK